MKQFLIIFFLMMIISCSKNNCDFKQLMTFTIEFKELLKEGDNDSEKIKFYDSYFYVSRENYFTENDLDIFKIDYKNRKIFFKLNKYASPKMKSIIKSEKEKNILIIFNDNPIGVINMKSIKDYKNIICNFKTSEDYWNERQKNGT